MIVDVTCRGLTPKFMNRMSESVLEGLRTKAKKPKTANIGNTRTPREEASEKLYLHGGKPILPVENLMSCLIGAGVFIRLDGKKQVSTAKSTVLPAFMTVLDRIIYLTVPDSDQPATWEADVRQGRNPNGGEAVALCRPRFDAWAFKVTIDIDAQEIGENVIRDLFDKAGKRIGLGDFRPSRKGIFGQFTVERWIRRPETKAAAAE